MKKIGFILAIFIVSILAVNAEENKITITEKGDKLYYQSATSSSDFFFNEKAMLPGEVYQKDLLIDNSTKEDYSLFLKIDPQDENASLLDYIDLKIATENGEVLYEGKMRGFVSNNDTEALQGTLPLGDFKSKSKSNLKFSVKLSSDYSNTIGEETTVDWTFYAKQGDEVKEIIENPKTWSQGNGFSTSTILMIILAIGLIVFIKIVKPKSVYI